jgi:hypothetical protein
LFLQQQFLLFFSTGLSLGAPNLEQLQRPPICWPASSTPNFGDRHHNLEIHRIDSLSYLVSGLMDCLQKLQYMHNHAETSHELHEFTKSSSYGNMLLFNLGINQAAICAGVDRKYEPISLSGAVEVQA